MSVEKIEGIAKGLSMKELKERAFIDYQTKVYNRAFFEEVARIEFAEMKRSNKGFSILFLDVDDLKKLNDTLGHVKGNELLASVGITLRDRLRASDIVARYGGDEFIALMNCGAEEASKVVSSIEFPTEVSYGIAEGREASSLEGLIDLADKRMYEHKRNKKQGDSSLKYSDLLKR